jgi:RNA polymerase sigma-70 factor (ECF subfamily)
MKEAPAPAQLGPDDQALLARLRSGEPAAYEELVRAETGKLLAVARRILPTEEDARDAVQDAFLFAFRSLGRFEGQARLSTWLHRIAVNASLMRLRTRRRKREEPLDPLLPTYQDDGHHVERFATWDDPTTTIEKAETKATPNAVKVRLHRARQALRTLLAPHFKKDDR